MIKAILIDDEDKARTLLSKMLHEVAPEVQILADCGDLPNGIKAIRKHKPDIVFLDIEMPGYSGLEILDFFNDDEINFSIIFVTAYNQYAIRALKMSAVDYLLKPVDPTELEEAIQRFVKREKRNELNYAVLKGNIHHNLAKKIAVPSGNEIRFIEFDEIVYLKADSSYTELFFANGEKLLVSRTLRNFEEVLNAEAGFFRCQKSYIVNIAYISNFVKSDGGYLIMRNDAKIPTSPDKSGELLELIKMIKR